MTLPAPYKTMRSIAGAGNVDEGGVGMAKRPTQPTEPWPPIGGIHFFYPSHEQEEEQSLSLP
jgi:hypothetical protein